ncbi:MAG: alpha/beta hydrolase [Clostridia bacterium]|nr:alpha/beta hydrolase [Clostridia bacterium]
MTILLMILGALLFLAAAAALTAYICFYMIFKRSDNEKDTEEYPIPSGKVYEPFREDMIGYLKTVRAMPCRQAEITSFDGLKLRGRYYEYKKGAPIELLFHGYRGTAERDLSGGVLRCAKLGRSALIVDHRAGGTSEGNVITFGINESRDAERWVDFILSDIDKDAKIILTGISMGAATVLITAQKPLPKNVVGVLADCGYTSAKAIIKKVMREMHLPANLLYPFARLGARLYGRFDIDETSPIEAMKNSRIPILFIHGDHDDFVPHEMSIENYNACISKKQIVTVKDAGHGTCYMQDPELYLDSLREFFDPLFV